MKYYYQNIVDEKPVPVTIIQSSKKWRIVEIIRDSQIKNRKHFAGFWVEKEKLLESPKQQKDFQ